MEAGAQRPQRTACDCAFANRIPFQTQEKTHGVAHGLT